MMRNDLTGKRIRRLRPRPGRHCASGFDKILTGARILIR